MIISLLLLFNLLNLIIQCDYINTYLENQKIPVHYLTKFDQTIDNDIKFFKEQLKFINEFKLEMRSYYEDHFKDNLKVKIKKDLTNFNFNKRSINAKCNHNSTIKEVYMVYLHDLQAAFSEFELLEKNLHYLANITERAKNKIHLELKRADNYLSDGLNEFPIKSKLHDYITSFDSEVNLVKNEMKFHFFNFFFLTKLLMSKESWIALNMFNDEIKDHSKYGPIHRLSHAHRDYQIQILDLITSKDYFQLI